MDATILLGFVGAFVVFTLAFLGGEDIAMQRITVPTSLEERGYTNVMVTKTLVDEMRRINESAALELAGIDLGKSTVNESLETLQDVFGLYDIVTEVKTAFGQIRHHVEGEVAETGGEYVITTRLFSVNEINAHGEQIVHVAQTRGEIAEVPAMVHEHAIRILDVLSPYVVAIYYFRDELANRKYEFPRARAQLERFMREASAREHYLAYTLYGRMHRRRAEEETTLTPIQRRAELTEAVKWLNAAVTQKPDFFYPHLNLGIVHADLGQYGLADLHFARAVALDPNDLTARRRWAEALAAQSRVRDAIFQYVAAVEIAPEDAALRHVLAELYVKAGRPDAARAQWETAAGLAPMDQTYSARLRSLGATLP